MNGYCDVLWTITATAVGLIFFFRWYGNQPTNDRGPGGEPSHKCGSWGGPL